MEIDNKLRELTEKIRKEGFEKAEAEAIRVREEVGSEAELIRENARKEAAEILEKARQEAEKYAERVRADLRLSIQQSLCKLRRDISELLLANVVHDPVKKNMNDPHFVTSMLLKVVENWKNCNEDVNLEIILPDHLHRTVEKQFRDSASEMLSHDLTMKPSKNISGGFEIRPSNGYYKISLTDEAFEEFLKEQLRPVVKSFLYGDHK